MLLLLLLVLLLLVIIMKRLTAAVLPRGRQPGEGVHFFALPDSSTTTTAAPLGVSGRVMMVVMRYSLLFSFGHFLESPREWASPVDVAVCREKRMVAEMLM